jgi:TonB family protein
MQKGIFLFLVMLVLSAFTCTAQKNKLSSVYMERTPCFGRCPWYNIYIETNGYIRYEGKRDADMLGLYEGTVPKSEVANLFKWLQKQALPSEETSYTVHISDLPRLHVAYKNKGVHVAIKNAQEGPDYWKEYADRMDILLQKASWKLTQPQVPDNSTQTTPEKSTVMPVGNANQETFNMVEQMPEFPGGQSAMMDFLRKNLQYPNEARDKNISGKVIVKFVIDSEGNIKNAEVIRGIGAGCDEEALRVVRKMPRWKPGHQNGKAVNVFFHLPVSFVLK